MITICVTTSENRTCNRFHTRFRLSIVNVLLGESSEFNLELNENVNSSLERRTVFVFSTLAIHFYSYDFDLKIWYSRGSP